MKTIPPGTCHRYGPNRRELAVRLRKRDQNFRQSRDVREDRGQRRMKTGGAPRTAHA